MNSSTFTFSARPTRREAFALSLTQLLCTVLLLLSAMSPVHAAAQEKRLLVGSEWVWFTDYAYLIADWTLQASSDCLLEVGTGMKLSNNPRGSRKRFEGHIRTTTWGLGSIHVRSLTPSVSCMVSLTAGHVEPLPIYSSPCL